ncbi:MAG: hypothetical protein FJW23_03605 [Acidimicrobiia bacterium]|nr:hypothetical protein [Acidimicrobiia bacterium]
MVEPPNRLRRLSAVLTSTVLAVVGSGSSVSGQAGLQAEVTFTKDIAPILQQKCQSCHRPNYIAPMALMTYEQVRPYARAIRQQTAQRTMPPWYIDRTIGIQSFKSDMSLSDEQIGTIARWVEAGAPEGSPGDLPPPIALPEVSSSPVWELGEPDLIVRSPTVTVKAVAPDWWGAIGETPTGLAEDRYVRSVEIREVNDVDPRELARGGTVGGLFVFHHANFGLAGPDGQTDPQSRIPAHEVGRNPDQFDPRAGRLLRAGSTILFFDNHLHANGVVETNAHLELGFRFHPKGYKPTMEYRGIGFGTTEVDLRPNEANQEIDAYTVLQENAKILNFEPHLHATGVGMCFQAIWGGRTETLNCAGYNHNWVRNYQYTDDSAPLLPKGTILKITGYFDTTAKNPLVYEPRNWTGWGNRSVDNMIVNLPYVVPMTDEQFAEAVDERRKKIAAGQATPIGCPTCYLPEGAAAGSSRASR